MPSFFYLPFHSENRLPGVVIHQGAKVQIHSRNEGYLSFIKNFEIQTDIKLQTFQYLI